MEPQEIIENFNSKMAGANYTLENEDDWLFLSSHSGDNVVTNTAIETVLELGTKMIAVFSEDGVVKVQFWINK